MATCVFDERSASELTRCDSLLALLLCTCLLCGKYSYCMCILARCWLAAGHHHGSRPAAGLFFLHTAVTPQLF
jgi:hypothetical protein